MKQIYIYGIIFVFTIILQWFVNENAQYVPMLLFMYISPFLLLWKMGKYTFRVSHVFLFLTIGMMFASFFTDRSSFRISTVLYSILFILTFICYEIILREAKISLCSFKKVLAYIVYAYSIVLVIQQVSIVLGIPVFNQCWEFESIFKLNSLAIEPSNIAPVLSIVLYTYYRFYCLEKNVTRMGLRMFYKDNRSVILSFLYVMTTCGSVSCIISIFVLLLLFINKRTFVTFSIIIAIGITILFSINTPVTERIGHLISSFDSLDVQALYSIDQSASARIAPFLLLLKDFNLLDWNFWLGHGCDYSEKYFSLSLLGYETGEQGIGGIIRIIYDYGFLCFIFYMGALSKYTRCFSYDMLMYFAVFFIIPFNHYLTWLFWFLIVTFDYYENLKRKSHQLFLRVAYHK